jgi:hypothetical protein
MRMARPNQDLTTENNSTEQEVGNRHEITTWLQKNMQQLETRLECLEKRLPLVERSTASLQSMLPSNREMPRKTWGLHKSHTPSSQSSNDPSSETFEEPNSSKRLSGVTESADFEEQLRLMLLAGKLRISLAGATKRTPSTQSSVGKGKQVFTFPNHSQVSPLLDDSPLDGDTLQWPNDYEDTGLTLDTALGPSNPELDLMNVSIWQDESLNPPCQRNGVADTANRNDVAYQRTLSPSKLHTRPQLEKVVPDGREIIMGDNNNIFPDLSSKDLFDFNYDPSDLIQLADWPLT